MKLTQKQEITSILKQLKEATERAEEFRQLAILKAKIAGDLLSEKLKIDRDTWKLRAEAAEKGIKQEPLF